MKALFIASLLFLAVFAQAQTFTSYHETDTVGGQVALVNDVVLSVYVDADDHAWFGTQEGISMYDGNAWTNFTDEDGLIFNTVKAIMIDGEGNLWAGTDLGISKMNDDVWSEYTTDDGLEDNKINCINEDSSGLIWFGHADGASSWNGSEFTNYTMDDGLPFGGVSAIEEDASGRIWMGTGLGGCFILADGTFTELNEDNDLLSNSVRAIAIDGNTKWIATNIGISVFNGSDIHIADHDSLITLPEPHEINPVEDVKVDSQGRVWTAVYVDYLVSVGGVSVLLGDEWFEYGEEEIVEEVIVEEGLAGPVVRELAITSDDKVWVATSTGVTLISDVPTSIESQSDPFDSAQDGSQVKIYPNPASNWVTITGMTTDGMLFDINGRKQMDINALGETTSIWIGDLKAGIYLIKAGIAVERIVVQ